MRKRLGFVQEEEEDLKVGSAVPISTVPPILYIPTSYGDMLRYRGLQRGTVRFNFAIDEQTSTFLQDQVDEAIACGCKEITLSITSPGGSIYEALGLFDYFHYVQREHGVRIEGRVNGYVASASAMVVLQAMAHRSIYPSARVMLHEAHFGSGGTTSAVGKQLAEVRIVQKMAFNVLSSRVNITEAQLKRETLNKDWWISAQKARDIGLVDEVLNAYAPDHLEPIVKAE